MRRHKTLSRQHGLFWQRCLLACCLWLCATAQAMTYSSAATSFNWIDPSAQTAVVWSNPTQGSSGVCDTAGDDSITALINIGFTFNFGGVNYTQLRIMSNGRVQFNNTYCYAGTQVIGPPRTYTLSPLPNANLVRTMKVYGADIDTTPNGSGGGPGPTTCPPATCSVRYTVTPLGSAPNRQFVVTWVNTPDWGSTGSYYNFQVILNEDGSFIYQYGPSNNPDGGKADIGWEVATTDYDLYTYTNIGALANTAIRFFIPAMLVDYRFDEGSWSGANSVSNSVSAGYFGTPIGTVAPTPSGYICGGANIPLNTSSNTVDAINTGLVVDSTLKSTGSVDFWYQGRTAWNDGNARMLLDGTSNNSTPFFLEKIGTGNLRFVLQDNSNNVFALQTTKNRSFAADTWHHIAVTWTLGGSGGMVVYVDGAVEGQMNINAGSALDNKGGTLYIGDNQGKAVSNAATGNSAYGVIDEMNIYNYAIPSTVVNRDMQSSHICSSLNNFLITIGSASASTCAPQNIQITARDANNNALTSYAGTVGLSTSSNHGDWSVVSANGSLAVGAADSGAAGYAFTAADNGTVTLALSDTHADDLTLSVIDSGAGVSATSSTLNFRDNAFVITPTDALGTTVVAARPHALSAAFWRKDPTTGNCAIATGYAGTKSLKAWLTLDAADPGGAAPTVTSVAPPTLAAATLPNVQPGTANFSLNFTAGVANFTLGTSDVGKYALNLLDDSRVFATGSNITGASSTLTTRPFGLAFTNIKTATTTNPSGANPTDAVFTAAGQPFQATVGAYLWQAADDLNNDGIPDAGSNITDNGLAQKFAWPVTLTAQLNTPSPGTLGALGGTTAIASASFSGGAATVGNLTYSEVGSMQMSANLGNYLNSSGVNLSTGSGVVGRFTPDHFMTSGLVNGSLNNGCGSFTYSGQQSGGRGAIRYLSAPQFTITAQSAANTTTVNYTGAFLKLAASGIKVTPPTQDATQIGIGSITPSSPATLLNLTSNITTGTLTDNGNGTLTYVLGNDDFAYTHEANAQIAPFTSAINLVVAGVQEPVADNVAANDLPKTLMPTGVQIRFGRLNLQNAYGSELLPLPINLTAEYWAGSAIGFVANSADGCTGVSAANVALTPNAPLVAGDTSLTVAANPFVTGSWHAAATGPYSQLSAPGAGRQGSVGLAIDLDAAGLPWMKYSWSGGSYGSPGALAVFGIYQGSGRRIYMHELFN